MFEDLIKYAEKAVYPENIHGLRIIKDDLKKLANRSNCPLCGQTIERITQPDIDKIEKLIDKLYNIEKLAHPERYIGTPEYQKRIETEYIIKQKEEQIQKQYNIDHKKDFAKSLRDLKKGVENPLPNISIDEHKLWNHGMECYLCDSPSRSEYEGCEELYFSR